MKEGRGGEEREQQPGTRFAGLALLKSRYLEEDKVTRTIKLSPPPLRRRSCLRRKDARVISPTQSFRPGPTNGVHASPSGSPWK